VNSPEQIEATLKSANYGATVKNAARQLRATGVATFDLPMERSSRPDSPFTREMTRVRGYVRSLNKIFGHPVRMYEHVEDGERFLAVSFE
jgi:hypothetical protein